MSSWVKLSRKLATSAIAAKPEYLAVWVHLLMAASYKEGDVLVGRQVVRLLPGQLVFGRHKFSEKTGVSEGIVRSALKVLESLQQITIKSESKFSVITITKWSFYQTDQPANNQQLTSKQPAVDHNKEVLELQEEDPKTCDPPAGSRKRVDNTPYEEIRNIYNEICVPVLPEALKLSAARKRNIKKCCEMEIFDGNPFQSGEFWRTYFNACLADSHWIGVNDRGWKADIEFLTREANVLKVLERT